jgi:hypothetical protein
LMEYRSGRITGEYRRWGSVEKDAYPIPLASAFRCSIAFMASRIESRLEIWPRWNLALSRIQRN